MSSFASSLGVARHARIQAHVAHGGSEQPPASGGAARRNASSRNPTRPPRSGEGPVKEERVLDLGSILSEAKGLGSDSLLFQDDGGDDEEGGAFDQFDARFATTPPDDSAVPQSEVRGALDAVALDPATVDSLSAYSPEQGFLEMGVEDLWRELPGPSDPGGSTLVLLDVRSAAEYASGHVPGALHVDLGRLSEAVRSGELDAHRGARLATVCETGARSAQAAVRLARVFGFADVANVRGGTRAWAEAGFGLEGGGSQE